MKVHTPFPFIFTTVHTTSSSKSSGLWAFDKTLAKFSLARREISTANSSPRKVFGYKQTPQAAKSQSFWLWDTAEKSPKCLEKDVTDKSDCYCPSREDQFREGVPWKYRSWYLLHNVTTETIALAEAGQRKIESRDHQEAYEQRSSPFLQASKLQRFISRPF